VEPATFEIETRCDTFETELHKKSVESEAKSHGSADDNLKVM